MQNRGAHDAFFYFKYLALGGCNVDEVCEVPNYLDYNTV